MAIVRYLLDGLGKKNTVVLFFIVASLSILDLISIALIFPFLKVVLEPGLLFSFFLEYEIIWFQHISSENLIMLMGCGLIFFYAVKTFIQARLVKFQANYLANFTAKKTIDLTSKLLLARYKFFQQVPASRVVGLVSANTVHATLSMTAILQMLNESLILLVLFMSVLVLKPFLALTLVIFIVIIGYGVFFAVVKPLHEIGKKQNIIENKRYRNLFSIASTIRDIKVMGLEALFFKRGEDISINYAEQSSQQTYKSSLTRLIIEFFALISLILSVLIIISLDVSLATAVPVLGVLAAAALRVIPSISKLFYALGQFRSSLPFCEKLMELESQLFINRVERKDDSLVFEKKIELKKICFSYEDKPVLKNITLHLSKGESIGIVGLSGAGKTTLLDVFTGLQQKSSGEFICDGKVFDPFTSSSIHKNIGYVSQSISLLDDTIAFNISLDEVADESKIKYVLKMANLDTFIESLPDGIYTAVGENGLRLSGGQRQRIGIARALYREPQILIFDEATSALDNIAEKELTDEIEKLQGTISTIIVAHRLSTIKACDRIYLMSDGAIDSVGTHEELLEISDTYKQLNQLQDHSSSY